MENNNISYKLRSGEKVECPECHKGYIIPFNTTADKAHAFICSNEECNWHLNLDPVIDIE